MPFVLRSTISAIFLERVKATPSAIGFKACTVSEWKEYTFQQFYDDCRTISFGLMGLGIEPEDKVAILASTRYEWSLCDMAILGCRAITVPIYPSNTAEDAAYILGHSDAKAIIVEDAAQLRKIIEKRSSNPEAFPKLGKVIVMEPAAMNLSPRMEGSPMSSKDILTLQALRELGKREEARHPGRFEDHLRSAKPEDLFTICYTSGTTGIPKGVMLTHDNMVSVLEDCKELFQKHLRPEGETVLSFLPFSHILGRVESMAVYVFGWREVFARGMETISEDLLEVRPTVIFTVPRIFEKAFNLIQARLSSAPQLTQKIFHHAYSVGKHYFSDLWEEKRPSLREAAEYTLAKTTLFSKIREGFGGQLRFAICGGAPLPKEIGEFFHIIGIPILEGYGLTETCAPITLNTPDHPQFGTVGKRLPEVTIRIADDGEILVKSRKIFKGYYKAPEETAEALEGGWFHTGDIGVMDDEGTLRITDRKKDLIITSAGKNIAPQKIENLAKSRKMIHQFMVHGDKRHYLTALVTLDRDQVIQFANEHQILFSEYSELVKNPKIIALVQQIIDEMNAELASFERIKKFVILPRDFSVEEGELTPSLKIRRKIIEQRYRKELDTMYAEPNRSASSGPVS